MIFFRDDYLKPLVKILSQILNIFITSASGFISNNVLILKYEPKGYILKLEKLKSQYPNGWLLAETHLFGEIFCY